MQGASVPLTNLLNSRNEAIAAYAAAALFKLSDGKSLDYKKQLTSELSSSLYRTDTSQLGGPLGAAGQSGWALPVGGVANAGELELSGLLFHPQFGTLTQPMTAAPTPGGPAVPNGIYQGVYAGQVR